MNGAPPSGEAPKDSSPAISLRILSPSFESSQRLSFDNLPASTTVADVKNLITPLAPNHPTPDQQRLIYRGRPLLDNSAALQDVLEPPLQSVHTLHLVLPPGPEISNNLYVASDSTLRYRNVPNPSPNRSASLFTAPGVPNAISTSRDHTTTQTDSQGPGQNSTVPPTSGVNVPSVQSRIPAGVGHPSSEELMRQAIEQHRRRAEELNMFVDRARTIINSQTTRIRSQAGNTLNAPRTENIGQFPRPPLADNPTVVHGANAQAPSANTLNIHNVLNNGVSQNLLVARITAQIMLFELDLDRGVAPSIDSIAAVRNQLYAISDARYRQPSIATGDFEGLIQRLQNINARAFQIRQSEYVRRLYSRYTTRAGTAPQTIPSHEYYLITTASGEQMMLTAPPPSTVQEVSQETVPVFPDPAQAARGNGINEFGFVPNNVMHNVVREAVLNQQPIRANNRNGNFGQNIRRFWLFMRLFFFCYLFTDSGSWERFLFVAVAAFIAFFSESNLTGRLFNFILQPIQRHLEGLIHGGAAAAAPAPAQQDNDQPNQPRAPTGGAQQALRRIERAVALFIASLIPGLGERQVEVRNAAEEAARNARQQEQARIEAANAQNHVSEQENPVLNQSEAAASAGGESSGNANTQQP
ncbi:hypothetical protein UA08_01042 [Talaromyces atroroseus]|uniref:Ubiquitin-like domain-containing protein n=1 Tax=Talaromyces atroroseus TaxID=1441469 RepID=A0A225B075_TALAT|nr:hypothetical protein UA08_01042 [Talaromyces atroroseus]OKL64104.1 hypothetical protein UA08_01042 [Talaromyces atroroseus]